LPGPGEQVGDEQLVPVLDGVLDRSPAIVDGDVGPLSPAWSAVAAAVDGALAVAGAADAAGVSRRALLTGRAAPLPLPGRAPGQAVSARVDAGLGEVMALRAHAVGEVVATRSALQAGRWNDRAAGPALEAVGHAAHRD